MSGMLQDFRYALRGLVKSPGFTLVAVFSLAVGIGANTAIFTLLDQVLLRRLPVKNPQELVALRMKGSIYGSNWGYNALSYPLYQDLSQNNQVFNGMFCRFSAAASLTHGAETERVATELVSGTYFTVLGVQPALGRVFTAEEDRLVGGHPVLVLNNPYWRARFSSDPSVVGREVQVNGHDYTVVGVTQPGFGGVELEFVPQVFVPITMKKQITPGWDGLTERRWRWVNAFGRLRPGVSREQAQGSLAPYFKGILEMEVKEAAFNNASPETREAFLRNVLEVLPGGQGRSDLRRQLEAPLSVLMALTAAVLFIACANVAGLLVARAAGREKEIAIRLALGAGRGRIVRLLLVEGLALASLGAVAGLFLAAATDHFILGVLPSDYAQMDLKAGPDVRILLFTAAVAAFTVLLVGLLPAGSATRPDVGPTLKEQAGTASPRHTRFRKALVGAQVALSMLLLVGAGLFARSLLNLRQLGPGFPTESLVAFNLNPGHSGYDSPRAKDFFLRLTADLKALPGVRSAGLASVGIMQGNEWDSSITVEGFAPKPEHEPAAYMNQISPGYFETMGVPIVAGRDFDLRDREEQRHGPRDDDWVPRVVMVNEKFARMFFGEQSAIGRRVGFGSDPGTPTDMEIVGVVKDIKYTSLRDEIPIQMFVPYLTDRTLGSMMVYVRTQVPPEDLIKTVRARVAQLDPRMPLYDVQTMERRISDSLLIERLVAGLSSAFGLIATLLACVGLYGVMAYGVARRTREIGVRMALGAFGGDVVWLILREVVVLLGIGLAVGLPAALGLGHWVRSQLFGVAVADPLTLAAATLCLTVAAGLAGYLPARRASRIDPLQALRTE
jgi:predicted permease